MLSNLYEGRVMIINKNFKVEKDTYGISEGKTIISEEVIKCFQGKISLTTTGARLHRDDYSHHGYHSQYHGRERQKKSKRSEVSC